MARHGIGDSDRHGAKPLLVGIMRSLPRNQRSGSFQLPRQAISPTQLSPMEAGMQIGSYDSPRDYSTSSGEYKPSTPPPNASLLDFLRENRSPAIEPRGATVLDAPDAEHVRGVAQTRQGRTPNTTRWGEEQGEEEEEEGAKALHDGLPAVSKSNESSTATSSSTPEADSAPTHGVKRSRYLREIDRRTIIRRIDSGEKQATLAKEFGVTRAAICHINKNRVEILMRSARADVHSAARHPKRGMYSTSKSSQFHHPAVAIGSLSDQPMPMVYEVRSAALTMLLTSLRRKGTACRDYRLAADRAFRMLLEEALATAPTHDVEVVTANDSVCPGVVAESPTCAIVMSECGYPMLEVFRSIQPDSSTGFMTLEHEDADAMDDDGAAPRVVMRKMCAPPNLRGHSLFLLDATCSTHHEAAVAIQSLVDLGAQEGSIFFVPLVISARAVAETCDRFPRVHVVTAAIDPEASGVDGMRPGIGNFQERYFNTTTIHQNQFGANVQL